MRLKSLHHAHFVVSDFEAVEAFATDFGLSTVQKDERRLLMATAGADQYSYIADRGPGPRFLGLGFLVEGMRDLEEAVERHGATPIQPIDRPGGGYSVTLVDPEGHRIELIAGVAEKQADRSNKPLELNTPGRKARRDRRQAGRPLQAQKLFRLGHVGLYVVDFDKVSGWYAEVLGLRPSELIHAGDPEDNIVAFYRLDRGDDYVDHHVLAFVKFERADCHHLSFEAEDFEAQFMAHRWMSERGYELCYGVGRHPLGSHVFDTWFNPEGYRWESFSDTDVHNAERPAGRHDFRSLGLDVWSSEPPDRYFA